MGSGAERKTLSFSRSGLAASLSASLSTTFVFAFVAAAVVVVGCPRTALSHSRSLALSRPCTCRAPIYLLVLSYLVRPCVRACVLVLVGRSRSLVRSVFADIVVIAVIVAFPSPKPNLCELLATERCAFVWLHSSATATAAAPPRWWWWGRLLECRGCATVTSRTSDTFRLLSVPLSVSLSPVRVCVRWIS